MAKVQDEMATRVSIDTIGAVKSYTALKDAVKSSISAFKAEEIQLKSSGQYREAAIAKVQGLTKTMELQKAKITELTERQKNLDTTTAKGQKGYMQLEQQIQSATRQMNNYGAQLDRAKENQKYYTNGLSDLQHAYKQTTEVSNSYIKQLKAEGKEHQATREEYKSLRSGLVNLSQQYSLQKKSLKEMQDEYANTSKSIADQERQMKDLAQNVGKDSKAYRDASQELSKLHGQLNNTNDALNTQKVRVNETGSAMMSSKSKVKELGKSYANISDQTAKLADLTDKAKSKMSKGWDSVKRGVQVAGAAVVAVGTIAVSGAKKASELQNSYKETFNLMVTGGEEAAEATKNVAIMQSDAAKYSVEYGKSQKSIADGYQDLIKRGYTSAQALGAMKSELQASVASGDDFSDVVTVASQALESFGLRSKTTNGMITNTKMATNQLAYAADLTSTGFSDLGVGMSYVGSTAHQAGFSLSETASAMGLLSNNGLEADKAGTGLRKAINSLISPTDGAADALQAMGLKTKDFVDKSGKMKSMTDIFGLLNQHSKDFSDSKRINLFHAIFGTTGQQAGLILADNADELGKLNEQVAKSQEQNKGQGYIATLSAKNMKSVKNELAQFKEAAEAASIVLGKAVLPALSESATQMAKIFNSKKGQETLKTTAELIGETATKTVKFVEYLVDHKDEVKGFAITVGSIWAVGKISRFITSVHSAASALGLLKSAGSKAGAGVGDNLIPEEVKLSGGASKVSSLTKGVGVAALAGTAIDVGSSIYTAVTSGKNKDKYKAAGKTAGAGIGAGIGAAIGSAVGPVGTLAGAGIGSAIGDALGSTKTAQNWTKQISKSLSNLKNAKVPKISAKGAYDELTKESKKYYSEKQKQDKKDIELLKKNGLISDAEYKKRSAAISAEGKNASRLEKMNQSDRTAISKYYAQERQKLEEKWDKQIRSDKSKSDAKITADTQKYGANSVQVQRDIANKTKKIKQDETNKTKALNDQKLKFSTQVTAKEAKLYTTLDGSIQRSSTKQTSILNKLTNSKKKLSNRQLQDAVNASDKEYQKTVANAEKQYNKISKTAEKQYQSVKSAAKRQRDSAKDAAEDQYKKTVDAANRQYKGSSKWAVAQRKKVATEADTQRKKAKTAADNQYKAVVDKAESQKNKTIDKAQTQKNKVAKHARDQYDQVTEKASKQSKNVVTHATNQANSSMKANQAQASGISGIWKSISDFFSKIAKPFGVKNLNLGKGTYSYTPANSHAAYSTGGSISKAGKALVGEAGIEARYKPYSGSIDFVGTHGAEFIDVQPGEQILNNKDAMKLIKGQYGTTLPGYAKGTFSIDDLLKTSKSKLSDAWEDISDKAGDALDKITHPAKTLKDIASKTFNLTSQSIGTIPQDISKGMVNKVVDGIADTINKLKKTISDAFGDAGGKHGNPGGSGVQRWRADVKRALAANGLSTSSSMINRVLRQMNTESGGNQKAKQPGADPDGDGSGPAIGLMQTKHGTFLANAFPGHKDIYNGYDNLLAALHYAKRTYGPSLSFLGNGHGYANGGIINSQQIAILGEHNKREAVIPWDVTKRSRAYELMQQTMAEFGKTDDYNKAKSSSTSTDTSTLESKIDTMIALLSAVVTAIEDKPVASIGDADIYNANKRQKNKLTTLKNMSQGKFGLE